MNCINRQRRRRIFLLMFSAAVIIGSQIGHLYISVATVDDDYLTPNNAPNDPSSSNEEADGNWVNHLCPHYSLQDTTNHLQLSWQELTEETMFFTETSCALRITGRQACAVESASRHHPHRPIQVLITAPSVDASQPLLKILLGLHNVQLAWLDLNKLFGGTPLQTWHQQRQWLFNEERASIFICDASRSEILRRYGGTYLDLDVITLRPLPNITNYLGRLDAEQIGGGVMSFTKGHPLWKNVVNTLPKVYDPYQCCTIGPELMTSVLSQLCPGNISSNDPTSNNIDLLRHRSEVELDVNQDIGSLSHLQPPEFCTDITIFPTNAFYPISFELENNQRFKMFKTGRGYAEEFLRGSPAYTLHLYNSLTKKDKILLGGDSILEEVAKINCPKVYKFSKEKEHLL